MKISQYDRVILKDGNEASIVEILEENKIITRMQTITGDGDTHSYEILVPDSEKEEAHNIILYME